MAHAPEIAVAMLRRQCAVSMVETALKQLSEREVVEDRKTSMVSNLLVVLCSGRDTQPVLNTGTLYGEFTENANFFLFGDSVKPRLN
ncbi:MAG TPA: hypothetical protein VJP88_07275 [Caulobacteraceae bacterium]|nr:hypothetical protein [Caulobacteraceae bacterium]